VKRSALPSGALTALAALVGTLALPLVAQAQRPPDFLLRTPRVSVGARVGYAVPFASSEIFDFTREQLTVERSDFNAPSIGGQLAIRVTPRVDIAVDLAWSKSETKSEFRDWVDLDDLPIEQWTEFQRAPVVFGVKAYLKERGRSIGRFAWIPEAWTPFVGGGAGWVFYRFEQDGEFVDFETFDIFRDRFTSEGSTPTIHVFGGADWSLGPMVFLTAEGRYSWAEVDMSGDFVDFDPMDLSGFQVTAGFSIRF